MKFSENKAKNNDKLNVEFDVTNAKNDKEFEDRFTASRIGAGARFQSPGARTFDGRQEKTGFYSTPHVMSLLPAGGAGNIGSYRNTNTGNFVDGGGAPDHDRRALKSVKKVLGKTYLKLGYLDVPTLKNELDF